jgi:hypothetical protein
LPDLIPESLGCAVIVYIQFVFDGLEERRWFRVGISVPRLCYSLPSSETSGYSTDAKPARFKRIGGDVAGYRVLIVDVAQRS